MKDVLKDMIKEELRGVIYEAIREILGDELNLPIKEGAGKLKLKGESAVLNVLRTDEEREELIKDILENPFISLKVKEEYYTANNVREAILFLEGRKSLNDAVLSSTLTKVQMIKLYHALAYYHGVPTKKTMQTREIKSISRLI